jgi:predicted dehydrogenase
LIDTAVQLMGLPNTVFTAAAGVSRPGGHFPYDTEDTGAIICQFTGGAIAVFSACWTSGPERWELEVYGTKASVCIDTERIVLRDRRGQKQIDMQARPSNPFVSQIEDFLSLLVSERKVNRWTLRQHLATMAVIQASYLSARTHQPESPNTIFEMHDIHEPSTTVS